MKKVMKKRAGFTLVELLIVIIIIGILAGAMLLVAGSGTDKAEATKAVAELRAMKAAVMMAYADHPQAKNSDFTLASIDQYMEKKVSDKTNQYDLQTNDNSGIFPGYYVTEGPAKKLDTSGLLYFSNSKSLPASTDIFTTAPSTAGWVYMKAK